MRGAPKSPNIVTSTFFNAIDLLPKDLRFEHWGARLVSCPGRHLTSLRPFRGGQTFWPEGRIRDYLAIGGPGTARFTWQTAVNAVALLSTVGNMAFKKKFARYLVGRIKLVGTADVDYEERSNDSTHRCRSPTPTVNGRDLTLPTRVQTSEEQYIDLTASNRRPSTPYSRNTPQSFSRGTRSYAFSRSTKHVWKFLAYSQDLSKICWRVKFCSAVLWLGWNPHWVSFRFGSFISRHLFSRHLAT